MIGKRLFPSPISPRGLATYGRSGLRAILLSVGTSVVRYEGELTLVNLVEQLTTGSDWRTTHGIAYLSVSVTPSTLQ
jgi:hypothetical protein